MRPTAIRATILILAALALGLANLAALRACPGWDWPDVRTQILFALPLSQVAMATVVVSLYSGPVVVRYGIVMALLAIWSAALANNSALGLNNWCGLLLLQSVCAAGPSLLARHWGFRLVPDSTAPTQTPDKNRTRSQYSVLELMLVLSYCGVLFGLLRWVSVRFATEISALLGFVVATSVVALLAILAVTEQRTTQRHAWAVLVFLAVVSLKAPTPAVWLTILAFAGATALVLFVANVRVFRDCRDSAEGVIDGDSVPQLRIAAPSRAPAI